MSNPASDVDAHLTLNVRQQLESTVQDSKGLRLGRSLI